MARCYLTALVIALGTAGASAAAENEPLTRVGLAGESLRTARRLAAADKLAAEEKWTEAIDEYQRLLGEAAGDLVPLGPRHSVQARRLCHLRLAALPPAARRLYRARVDGQARKWLEQGRSQRDAALLRRLVEETFCSRFTDQALDLLGDLAFERGQFEEAEHWWRLLAVPASEARVQGPLPQTQNPKLPEPGPDELSFWRLDLGLVFPDPQVDVARVRAKQLLARLFRGERDGWEEELKAFADLHGKAGGALAGRRGSYAAILQALAGDADTLAAPPGAAAWPTFAGAASRQRLLARAEGRLARLPQVEGPQWVVRLDGGDRVYEASNAAAATGWPMESRRGPRPPSYPLLVGDCVLVADALTVAGYDLRTGRPVLRYALLDHLKEGDPFLGPRPATDPSLRFTLTATEDRVYARLGVPGIGPTKGAGGATFLVCLDLHAPGEGSVQRWKIKSQAPDGAPAFFEGAPVHDQGRVYIALTRCAGIQTQTALACYDADTGTLRWQRDVCDTQELKDNERRYRHHLVTVAGPNVVYCSHSGAIVALDAASGRPVWAVRYPSRGPRTAEGQPSPRDLAPCLHAGGRLFVAPLDSDRIRCLDPDTGEQLWESNPVEVIDLLGVARGRLVFTAVSLTNPQPLYSIQALRTATGTSLREGCWSSTATGLAPAGRGLLAGDRIFWPTAARLYVLDQEGSEILATAEHIGGNLAAARGCLVVAGKEYLSAYLPERLLLEQRRKEAAAAPQQALSRYRLALAEAEAGMPGAALANLIQAEELADPGERWHGIPLRDRARQRRHQVLLDAALAARRDHRWDDADALLEQAAGRAFPPAARLKALARRAALAAEAGRPASAVAAWQSILDEPALGQDSIVTADQVPHAAALLAAERIDELIQAHGRDVYEAIEERARRLLAAAREEERKEVLGRLGRAFPNAAVTGPALLELARQEERAGSDGAAAQAYRQFLRRREENAACSVARAGLARAYERQNCWAAARKTWQELARTAGAQVVAELDPQRPVRDFVARQLQKAEYRLADPAAPPDPFWPLVRTWQSEPAGEESDTGERCLAPAGGPGLAAGKEYLFAVRGQTLICREALRGRPCWRRPLAGSPAWVGCFADLVLVAAGGRIRGLRLADGEPVWSWSAVRSSWPEGPSCGPGPADPELSAFRLAGSRLFFLQGERRLFALDAASGKVLWALWAPGARLALPYPAGRFYPHYYAGEERLVVQTTGGRLFELAARTGWEEHETATSQEPWPRPPLPLARHRVLLVPDAEHLVLLDLTGEGASWTRALERPASLTGEAPQVLGNGTALLLQVARNYGFFLEHLDPLTGRPRWPRALFLGNSPADLECGTLDETAAYFVRANALEARALVDGRLLWQRPLPLPAGRWRTLCTRGHLLSYPCDREAVHLQCRWLLGTVELQLALPRQTRPGGYFPVLLCDARTGELVERLNFPAAAPRLLARVTSAPALALLPAVRYGSSPVAEPACGVRLWARGLAVVLDGKAWGLMAAREY